MCDIGGIILWKLWNIGVEIIDLCIGVKLNGMRIMVRGISIYVDYRLVMLRVVVQVSKIRLLINKFMWW